MFKIDPSRAIGAYAAVMTSIAAYVVLGAATTAPPSFDTIDVKRINVREDDGTLRMIIAGRDHIGGLVIGDREYPHPNRTDRSAELSLRDVDGRKRLVFRVEPAGAASMTFLDDRGHAISRIAPGS